MKRIKLIIGLATTLCCLASISQATLLVPGGFGVPPAGPATPPGGAPMLVGAYANGTLTGSVGSWAAVDPLNPFGAGALTFYYQIFNTGSSIVEGFTVSGFGGVGPVDVTFIPAGPGTPLTTSRSFFDGGNIVGFQFPGVAAIPGGGVLSDILVVHTSWVGPVVIAKSGVIDGVGAGVIPGVLAPVPEPSTVIAGALLLLPFGASTIRFLRKSRTA